MRLRLSGRGRAALVAVLACTGAGATALPALTARDRGGDPPRVTGPLTLIDQSCGQKGTRLYCNFDYLLDPLEHERSRRRVARVLGFSGVRGGGQSRFLYDRGRRRARLGNAGGADPHVSAVRGDQGRSGCRRAARGRCGRQCESARQPRANANLASRDRHGHDRSRPAVHSLGGRDDARHVAAVRAEVVNPNSSLDVHLRRQPVRSRPPVCAHRSSGARLSRPDQARREPLRAERRTCRCEFPAPTCSRGQLPRGHGQGRDRQRPSYRAAGRRALRPLEFRPIRVLSRPLRGPGHLARADRHAALPPPASRPLGRRPPVT